jgi:hypothetical protein
MRHSAAVWQLSHTASFTAIVQAIEALVPAEEPDICPACKRNRGKGPTASFKDFLEQHAGASVSRSALDELYSMRSAISHRGVLLRSDLVGAWGGLNPLEADQRAKQGTAQLLARLALINWLDSATSSA